MPLLIRCSSCNKPLKVRDELAGKKVKCPNCGVPVLVKAEEPMLLEEVIDEPAPASAKPAKAAPAAIQAAKPEPPELEPAELEPVEEEENVTAAPSRPKRRPEAAEAKTKPSSWVPCPKCGAAEPKRVKFTFWGSFYGPKMFNHVRCLECGATYNGKTGGSNTLPAIGCILVPLFGIILILSGLGGFVYYRLVYQPAQELRQQQLQQQQAPPGGPRGVVPRPLPPPPAPKR
jgi:DNA-directed RNA polymerase subunit RPC12/RpoP